MGLFRIKGNSGIRLLSFLLEKIQKFGKYESKRIMKQLFDMSFHKKILKIYIVFNVKVGFYIRIAKAI